METFMLLVEAMNEFKTFYEIKILCFESCVVLYTFEVFCFIFSCLIFSLFLSFKYQSNITKVTNIFYHLHSIHQMSFTGISLCKKLIQLIGS